MPFDVTPEISTHTTRQHTDCLVCPVQGCLGRSNGESFSGWTDTLGPRQAVMPGSAPLFRAGERPMAIYSVRGGCLKTATVDADGNEHIRGFYLPGDIIGLDALGMSRHLSTATAVIPSQVCVAPLHELRRSLDRDPMLAQRLLERSGQQLAMALAISGNFTAEQRIAAFLIYMQQRLPTPSGALRLPMPQRDIGSYLRLATETVCRTLKGFAQKGWVATGNDRALRIIARDRLLELAEPVGLDVPAPMQRAA